MRNSGTEHRTGGSCGGQSGRRVAEDASTMVSTQREAKGQTAVVSAMRGRAAAAGRR